MKKLGSSQNLPTEISPILDRCDPKSGKGLAGFTVQVPSEPFENHIRFYDSSNRDRIMAELTLLRKQILDLLNPSKDNK